MATHSSILAWEIPRTEKPGGLQSLGSQRVGLDLATTQQKVEDLRVGFEVLGKKGPVLGRQKQQLRTPEPCNKSLDFVLKIPALGCSL